MLYLMLGSLPWQGLKAKLLISRPACRAFSSSTNPKSTSALPRARTSPRSLPRMFWLDFFRFPFVIWMNRRILPDQTYGARHCGSGDSAASGSRSANQLSREQIDGYVASAADGEASFLAPLARGRRRIFVVGFAATRNSHQYLRCAVYNGVAEDSVRVAFDVCGAVDVAAEGSDEDSERQNYAVVD